MINTRTLTAWPPQLSTCCDAPVMWWHSFCTEEHVLFCVKCQQPLEVVRSEEMVKGENPGS